MKHRSIGLVILWGIITLGIYDLVWIYRTRNEMVARGARIPNFMLFMTPIIVLLGAFVLLLIGLLSNANTYSDSPQIFDIVLIAIIVLAFIAMFPITVYWFYKYSQGVEYVTGGQTSKSMSFWLFIVLWMANCSFVWPAVIQDGFNNVSEVGPIPGQNPNEPYSTRTATTLASNTDSHPPQPPLPPSPVA